MDSEAVPVQSECNGTSDHECLAKFRLCANCESQCRLFAMLESLRVKPATARLPLECSRSHSGLPINRLLAVAHPVLLRAGDPSTIHIEHSSGYWDKIYSCSSLAAVLFTYLQLITGELFCRLDCLLKHPLKEMEIDHIQPLSKGGHPSANSNLQLLCSLHNRIKSNSSQL
jgi:5-methylcytosine-specific restriction endonuclease McrA